MTNKTKVQWAARDGIGYEEQWLGRILILIPGFGQTGRLPLLVKIRQAHFNRRSSRSVALVGERYSTD